ncbi:predicted protein [Sclerotinia sclerotiorum 1980 UF-70]|uniref:Uncharacterized protein n=1 Tax=Sclerotinia sclerotiorum (strain ATCC 18683 / 1980 / Ss-1) TaxID=665079 RepID=A7EGF5_SCLS1|nr:predicted protein [Sclerotinia sclerotiorum 1980 UF-70]EDO01921.1 predicted protein [Sclerotinia sclerotiorum 1980 UF-70]
MAKSLKKIAEPISAAQAYPKKIMNVNATAI